MMVNNVAPTEEQRLDEIKEAFAHDLISVERLEEDVLFVLKGGYFSGSYSSYVRRESWGSVLDSFLRTPVLVDGEVIGYITQGASGG